MENLGNGSFKYIPLPTETQVSPINGMVKLDYNNDQKEDILLVGNNYGNEVFIGRYDAFNGGLLKNNGKGKYEFIPTSESGILVPGDAKSIITVNSAKSDYPYFIASQNRDSIRVFQKR